MAGEYYRAKQRTGGFSESLRPIMDYFKEKKEKEDQRQNLARMMDAFTEAQGKIRDDNFGDAKWNPNKSALEPTMPGKPDYTGPEIEQFIEGKTDERQQKRQDVSDDFYVKEFMRPGADPERIDPLAGLLQDDVESLSEPEPELDIGKYNAGEGFYDKGSGKVLKEAIPPTEKEEKTKQEIIALGIGNYGGVEGMDYGYVDEDNKRVVTKFDQFNKSGSGRNNALDKDGFPDVTDELSKVEQAIASITSLKDSEWDEGLGSYQVIDDQGETHQWSQKQMNRSRDFKKNAVQDQITKMVEKRGLNDPDKHDGSAGAIETIREMAIGDTKRNIKDIPIKEILAAINKFVEKNKDYLAEKVYLIAYFKIMKL